ncbi:carbohydrate sulfotransferase 5-like [Mixophyes fleayi]|uniref:carbohydrate sulfotransferase 5-like n=1 Tax=Mixophyes fleayi TaxID=3061075 RepID=UPI003F4DBE27
MVRLRIKSFVLVVFIFIHFVLLIVTHRRQTVHSMKTDIQSGKVHLLILSTWRSGSSLLGQIFSQHPDVFYLMEPAWHIWRSMSKNSAHVLSMQVRDMVYSIFRCDMSVFDAYMKNKGNISDLFQWYSSRALCSPPACNSFSRYDIMSKTTCRKLCGIYPISKVEQVCDGYSHTVVKEVRFLDLKVLFPLLKDPFLNVKILHLVRDPRAVGKSREQAMKSLAIDNGIMLNTNGRKINDTNYDVLRQICQSQVDMYKTAIHEPPPFLKGRYKLVRYEDLVRNPLKETQEMYKFANLTFTDQISSWIYNITHGYGPVKREDEFEATQRDALNVSQVWRSVLPFQKVRDIQDVCKDAMNIFGYQFMNSETQQRDMHRDFILPRQTN